MSRTLIAPPTRIAPRLRPSRFLAAGLATVVAAAGGAVLAASADRPVTPTKPDAAPIVFGDPAVVKGARGGETGPVTLQVFGDPTVRKGAGGR